MDLKWSPLVEPRIVEQLPGPIEVRPEIRRHPVVVLGKHQLVAVRPSCRHLQMSKLTYDPSHSSGRLSLLAAVQQKKCGSGQIAVVHKTHTRAFPDPHTS